MLMEKTSEAKVHQPSRCVDRTVERQICVVRSNTGNTHTVHAATDIHSENGNYNASAPALQAAQITHTHNVQKLLARCKLGCR